jgi:hypothetical protein
MLEQSTVGGLVGYGSLSPSDFTGYLQYFVFGRQELSFQPGNSKEGSNIFFCRSFKH